MLKKVLLGACAGLAMTAAAGTANAHLQEFAWNDNLDGTVTFYGSSYHSGSQYSTSGLVLDGVSFNYTSLTSISDAAWTALLGTLDGFQFIEDWSPVDGYGAFTLTGADFATLGWSAGTFSFTASGFSSGQEFTGGGTYTNNITISSVAEPAALGLFGLGLVGLGLAARRRKTA